MNRKLFVLFLVVFVLLFASTGAVAQSLDPSAPQAPLGTGFTYQGQLKTASGLVNGACNLQFSLWDAAGSGSPPTGGAQIGNTQSLVVTVTNGLFTVVLNAGSEFGAAAFTGEARWLQITARCPAGSGSYATLSPRQALTATPYALSLMPNATINGLNNTGNLSFGLTTRQMLNLWGTRYGIGVQSYDMYFRTDTDAGFAWYTGGAHSDTHYDPGCSGSPLCAPGLTLMTLDRSGGLKINTPVSAGAVTATTVDAGTVSATTVSAGAVSVMTNGGIGVLGGSADSNGVQGQSFSQVASGVYGENMAGGYGVAGRANGTGTAVLGDNPSAGGYAGLFHGRVRVEGNLEFTGNLVGGNKLGYVSDFALNASEEALSTGDVVVVVGYTTPIVGTIPVARVVKASSPYQTGVVGVVDQHVMAGNGGNGLQFHDEPAAPGEHVNIVTLGMYRSIKVDAGFAAIHAGDLLVASPHAGYAMKATDRTQALGAIVGKALGDLATGEGTLPVIVTLQ